MLKKSRRKKEINNKNTVIVLLLTIFTALFILFDARLRPLVINTAIYKVQTLVTQAANQAIIEQMEKTTLSYGDLITVSRDEKGDVSLLSYNALEVNRLKSQITSSVIEKVNKITDTDIYIPIGNITNIELFQNKGPALHFRITPTAYVETDIESSFETTGINQVNHRIFIVLKIKASALVPNYSSSVEFRTKVCVAQTVIIGKVPNNISDSLHYME